MSDCFEWQTRVSDYLDGTLIGAAKRDADKHLDECEPCSERYKHYRVILSTIANQPRSSLPIPIRKSPLSRVLPRLELALFGRSRWEQVPWPVRTMIEGTGIVLVILAGISVGPKLRSLYEKNIERRLSEFADPMNTDDLALEHEANSLNAPPLVRGVAQPTVDEFNAGDSDDAGDSDSSSDADAGTDDSEIRVGSSETWRFNLKTVSPHDFRRQVVQILSDLQVSPKTPGIGGIEAPGGIQFDLEVPKEVVPGLKKQLQAAAPKALPEFENTPVGETFTWYKNKSKRKVSEGKARVVIWLSQM